MSLSSCKFATKNVISSIAKSQANLALPDHKRFCNKMAFRCLEGVMSKKSIISLDAEDIEALFKKNVIWSTFHSNASCSIDIFAAINDALNESFIEELSMFNPKHLLVYIEISEKFYRIKDVCEAINFICVRIGIEKHIVNFGVGLSGKNEEINLTFLVAE